MKFEGKENKSGVKHLKKGRMGVMPFDHRRFNLSIFSEDGGAITWNE